MIYLDNAATSYPKPRRVIAEINRCLQKYSGNPGRSGHRLSVRAAEHIYEARERVAAHLSLSAAERVVFTPNATYALNIAIKGLITEPCHVIISDLEHNSVIRPVYSVTEALGGDVSVFDTSIPLRDAIIPLIRSDTRFIVCTSCSNVTGKQIDIYELSVIAEEHGLGLILDLSQSAGHHRIDASRLRFSALCAPGHKGLFGIQGSGFAVFGENEHPVPLIEGGSGSNGTERHMPNELPEGLEGGTLFTPAICSLSRGIEFINEYGIECIEQRLTLLTERAYDRLSSLPFAEIYGAHNGIVAFNVCEEASERVAARLDERGIAVRGGIHCAPLVHSRLGTLERGAVRVSFSVFNGYRDIDRLYSALKREFG